MTIISSLGMFLSFHVVKKVSEIIVILFKLPFSNYNSLFLFNLCVLTSFVFFCSFASVFGAELIYIFAKDSSNVSWPDLFALPISAVVHQPSHWLLPVVEVPSPVPFSCMSVSSIVALYLLRRYMEHEHIYEVGQVH